MRRLETIKNIGNIITEKRIDLAVGLVNMVKPIDPNEPPITRDSLRTMQEQVDQELKTDGESHVLVDFFY